MTPTGLRDVSPEEVSLETYSDRRSGIWAAFHLSGEYANGKATSAQKNGALLIDHQQLDTTIEKGGKLDGTAIVSMTAQTAGVREVPFALFPTLRVFKVSGQDGGALNFIQENKEDDPQFWLVLPKTLGKGEHYSLTVTYSGKDAVVDEGNGNYYPRAREDWYPNSAYSLLREYSNYDMTFRVPKGMKLVATGSRTSETTDSNHTVSVWKSEVPITVAGFNLGNFKQQGEKLQKPEMLIES